MFGEDVSQVTIKFI